MGGTPLQSEWLAGYSVFRRKLSRMEQQGHAFRGEYINLCAKVERWMVEALAHEPTTPAATDKPKMPHLSGQKIKAIVDLAKSSSGRFAKPKRVTELFAAFQPYAVLRSELAHATMTIAQRGDDTLFLFEKSDAKSLPEVGSQFWFTKDETASLLKELKQISNQIADQKFKS